MVYDDTGGSIAARFWWMLRWLGHDAVALLDGGWRKWLREDRPVSDVLPELESAHFMGTPHDALWVKSQLIAENLEKPSVRLIDARSPERFMGIGETLDPVGGHIPGACNYFFQNNLDSMGCFKPAAELRNAFLAVIGDKAPQDVVHQCGSGVTACHNLLAMEIAGLKGSRLYPGSWSEWCADPERPMVSP